MATKKIVAVLLSAIMIASIAACASPKSSSPGASAPAAGASSTDPITLKLFYGYEGSNDPNNDMFKWVEEQTGISLVYEYLVGDVNSKIGVMLASGDYPDLLWGHLQHQKFIDAGACIPLDDYLEKFGDNLKKYYSPAELKALRRDDGKLYYFSCNRSFNTNSYAVGGFYAQRRVLEDAGYPKLNTLDQYFDLLIDYCRKNPETDGKKTYAFSVVGDSSTIGVVMYMACTIGAGFPDDGYDCQVDLSDYTAHAIGRTEGARLYLQAMNRLHLEGLLDPESFTYNLDTWNAKLATGNIVGQFNWWWQISSVQRAIKDQEMHDKVFVALPVTWDTSRPSMLQKAMAESVRDGVSISTKCANPERAFKFIDWLLNEEVLIRNSWGVEGKDYFIDSDGLFARTDEQIKQVADSDYSKSAGLGILSYPFPHPHDDLILSNGNAMFPSFQQSIIDKNYDEHDQKVLEAYGVKQYGFMFPQYEPLKYGVAWDINFEDGSDAQIAERTVYDLQYEWFPKLVMAEQGQFNNVWDQYMSEFDKTNYQAMEDFMTAELQRRVAEAN